MFKTRYLWLALISVVVIGLIWAALQYRKLSAPENADLTTVAEITGAESPGQTLELKPAAIASVSLYENSLIIRGEAMPQKRVSLKSADGRNTATFADVEGNFEIVISELPEDLSTYVLEMQGNSDRRLRSSGKLVIDPSEELRVFYVTPGAPADILWPVRASRDDLEIWSADFDNSGRVVFNGHTAVTGMLQIRVGPTLIAEEPLSTAGEWSVFVDAQLPPQAYVVSFNIINDDEIVKASASQAFSRFVRTEEGMAEDSVQIDDMEPFTFVSYKVEPTGIQHILIFK